MRVQSGVLKQKAFTNSRDLITWYSRLNRLRAVAAEIQGDCVCERPFDKVTRVVNKEIVCKCPRNFVPTKDELDEEQDEDPEEMEYEDG